jgi:site-specific recombinase XerC
MLRVAVPGFVGRPRRHALREPFADRAPGFSNYLRDERGLREATLGLYDEHLRAFATYLTDLGVEQPQALSPTVVSGFLTDRSQASSAPRCRLGVGYFASFSAICIASGLVARDLNVFVEAAPRYRLAHLPRSIAADDVRRMLEGIDRRTILGRRDYAMLLLLVTLWAPGSGGGRVDPRRP